MNGPQKRLKHRLGKAEDTAPTLFTQEDPMITDAKQAVAYIRVSTDKRHDSANNQRADLEAYAKRCGFHSLQYSDEAVSDARQQDTKGTP
jgi:hypothetical protein